MSLTVKNLNGDATFLLTFSPLHKPEFGHVDPSQDYRIVTDPWLTGSSKVYHPKFSLTSQITEPCVSSLADMPEPDLIVISQSKSDHCNEQTLRTLPQRAKTVILAEAGAAKLIRGWKHFKPDQVVTLPKYTTTTKNSLHRISIPARSGNGQAGEITVGYVAQSWDMTGLHCAIGITYRPPIDDIDILTNPLALLPLTPPDSPLSAPREFSSRASSARLQPSSSPNIAAMLPASPALSSTASQISQPSPLMQHPAPTLSVLHCPHGIHPSTLQPYIKYLSSSGALPLTLLLHCFDAVSNPWYLGGIISPGLPNGAKLAQLLQAKTWISAHDEPKKVTGWSTKLVKTKVYSRDEVESVVSPRSENFPEVREGPDVRVLGVGEQILLS